MMTFNSIQIGTSNAFNLEKNKHCDPASILQSFNDIGEAKRNCSQNLKCVAIEDTACNNKGKYHLCEKVVDGSKSRVEDCIYSIGKVVIYIVVIEDTILE